MGWISAYGLLDLIGAIWPYNAGVAAGPLAAAILGHLPGAGSVTVFGQAMTEEMFVRFLGVSIFVLAFVPLIFGGTIYRMLEKVMSLKLILILGYLTFVAVFLVSPHNMWEVVSGFVEFGTYPQRAETIIVDPHFHFTLVDNADRLLVKGTMEKGGLMIAQYQVNGVTQDDRKLSADERARRDAVVAKAVAQLRPGSFFVETQPEEGAVLSISGRVDRGVWTAERFAVGDADGVRRFDRLEDAGPKYAPRLADLLKNQGLEKRNLAKYVVQHRRLPDIRLVHAGRLHRDRRRRRTVEQHVFQLHSGKGLGDGCPRGRHSQRHRRPHHQLVARGQRVFDRS